MQITVSSRHMDVNEALKSHVTEKAGKLARYYDRVHSVDVMFEEQAGSHVVEMIARADHHTTFIAKFDDSDAYASVDHVVKDIERQLTRHKEKFRNRKHLGERTNNEPMEEAPSVESQTKGGAP